MQPIMRIAFLVGFAAAATALPAQQATISAPFGQVNHSFFEQTGVGFGLRGPGFFFQQSSFGQALPPFGGFAPGAGANAGFAITNGQNQGYFNFALGQGSRSSMVSQSASVTVGNGGFGSISAGSWTPFVVGAIPVVGGAPMLGVPFGPATSGSVLEERLSRIDAASRTATAAAPLPAPAAARNPPPDPAPAAADASGSNLAGLSVADIKAARAAEKRAEQQARQQAIDELIARGEAALANDKPGVARIYFQQAARRAEGEQQARLKARISALNKR